MRTWEPGDHDFQKNREMGFEGSVMVRRTTLPGKIRGFALGIGSNILKSRKIHSFARRLMETRMGYFVVSG